MNAQQLFNRAEDERGEEKLDQAVTSYKQAKDVSKKEGNDWVSAESSHMVGVIFYQRGEYDEAKKALEIAYGEFKVIKDFDLMAATLRDLGLVLFEQKDYQGAERYLKESIKSLKNSSLKGHLGISQVKLGKVLGAQGKLKEAEKIIEQGIENIEKSPEKFFASLAYFDLSGIQKQLGKEKEAQGSMEKSLVVLDQAAAGKHDSRREKIKKELEKF